ncbi:MAG: hypothetical protein PHY31_01020 [Smithellaceae bacterium]|nr:hypothetical protein [Smithellaceae bacterium]
MERLNLSHSIAESSIDIEAVAGFSAGVQKEDGEIPWSEGGKTDPWDLVESAMGLSVAGRLQEAKHAYEWMKANQLDDGSWWAAYRKGRPEDKTKDSNMSSYIAVGVFHYYLVTEDTKFLKYMWPTVRAGINYALSLQAPTGEIYWAKNGAGKVDRMALLTGSSSIYMSLKCGIKIASMLGKGSLTWERAKSRLETAICTRPDLFNMMKTRYSMDWYYPVLCGAVRGTEASKRIDRYWEKFVVPDWGVRCVCDRPWATMAETSELVLALSAMGEKERARLVFNWIKDKKYDDGSYWMGVTFPDAVIWPEEKTAWTAAAVLLAYDALNDVTPGGRLFSHEFWNPAKRVAGSGRDYFLRRTPGNAAALGEARG